MKKQCKYKCKNGYYNRSMFDELGDFKCPIHYKNKYKKKK